jgi:hypothetical protein
MLVLSLLFFLILVLSLLFFLILVLSLLFFLILVLSLLFFFTAWVQNVNLRVKRIDAVPRIQDFFRSHFSKSYHSFSFKVVEFLMLQLLFALSTQRFSWVWFNLNFNIVFKLAWAKWRHWGIFFSSEGSPFEVYHLFVFLRVLCSFLFFLKGLILLMLFFVNWILFW